MFTDYFKSDLLKIKTSIEIIRSRFFNVVLRLPVTFSETGLSGIELELRHRHPLDRVIDLSTLAPKDDSIEH